MIRYHTQQENFGATSSTPTHIHHQMSQSQSYEGDSNNVNNEDDDEIDLNADDNDNHLPEDDQFDLNFDDEDEDHLVDIAVANNTYAEFPDNQNEVSGDAYICPQDFEHDFSDEFVSNE